jgi:hypothetical protein
MFRAIKDTNTGFVYDWVKTLGDGTELSVNIPSSMWKREQDWTNEEIEALFSVPVQDEITDSVTIHFEKAEPEEKAEESFL